MNRLVVACSLSVFFLPGCIVFFDDDCPERQPGSAEPVSVGFLNPFTGQCEALGSGPGGGGTCGDYGFDDTRGAPDIAVPDWAQCFTSCTGLGEDECKATSGCRAGYIADCPEGQACPGPGYRFYECWQVAPSGPIQGDDCSSLDAQTCSRHDDCVAQHATSEICSPGGDCRIDIGSFQSCAPENVTPPPPTCFGEVLCDALPPSCPANTLPGRLQGCWSGGCIAVASCEPAPSCDVVATEAACVAQEKCSPIYEGENCSCDAEGTCTCQQLNYDSCQGI